METVTLTHIGFIRAQNQRRDAHVCTLLGWTWDQYTDHQFEQYWLFVDKICRDWPAVRAEIMHSPIFRGFWINEWNRRTDVDWLPMARDNSDSMAYIMDEYLYLHSHVRLLNNDEFLIGYHHVTDLIRKGGER